MTVAEKSSRKVITGAGWANPLTHDYAIESASWVHVFADDVELVGGVDYVVSDVLNAAGYVVTIVDDDVWTPTVWVLDARPAIDQGKDLTVGGTFGAKYEDGLDKVTRRLQRVYDLARRGLKSSLLSPLTDDGLTLPLPSAGSFIGWDSGGDALENKPGLTSSEIGYLQFVAATFPGLLPQISDAVSQGSVPIYSIVQGISALTIPIGLTAFRTNGYATVNDGGAWPLVVEVTNTGTLQPWQRQSNGGTRRWQLACAEPWIEMFGGKADAVYTASAITSGTDNLQPFYDMVAYSKATYGGTLPILPVVFGAKSGAYRFTDHVNVKAALHVKCLANSGASGPVTSSCVFPPDSAGFIFHRADTIDFVKETVSTGQADGSIWEGPRVLGTGGTSDLGYGIQLRCRVELRNPLVHNFSFAGVYIVATSGSGVAARQGNANYWRARGGRITGSRYGCWVEGADVNGGAWFGGEFNGNKIAGVYDNSFLGCDWVACSTDGNVSATYPTIIYDTGKAYAVVDPVLASTTQPTQANSYPRKPFTDSPVWVEYGTQGAPSTNIPQWTNGMTLYQGGSIILRGDSSKSTRHGGYDEPNQAYGYVSPNCSTQGGPKRMLGPGCVQQGGDWSGLSSMSSAVYRALTNGTLALGFTFFNRAAGNSRVTRLAWAQGYLTDGVTEKTQVVVDGGKIGSVPSLAVSFNQGNDDNLLDLAFEVLGTVTKIFRPGVDNVWAFGSFARRWATGWFGNISLFPAASVTPANNGEVTFQLTSNTSLTFKVKGSDGTVRSGSITLS